MAVAAFNPAEKRTMTTLRRLPYALTFLLGGLLTLAVTPPTAADDQAPAPETVGLLDESFDQPGEGAPDGWQWRGGNTGTVETIRSGDEGFVRLTARNASSYVQRVLTLPEYSARVDIVLRHRHSGIEAGDEGYQRGKIQGRFTRDGQPFGQWIGMGNLIGDADGWTDVTRGASVPEDADGLMLRFALYDVRAGTLDVASARVTAITAPALEAHLSAQRAQYRPTEPYGPPVSQARLDRLQRGININNWFGQPYNARYGDGVRGTFSDEHITAFITDHDLTSLRDAGFDHVRLALEPVYLMDVETGDLDMDAISLMDREVQRILDHDLAVIIDAHPKIRSSWFRGLRDSPMHMDRLVHWWEQLGAHLHETTDPELVFIELLNEPGGQGFYNQRWDDYQDRLITAVRAVAPDHTLIANDGGYQLVDHTIEHVPHPDRNVIYAVHYYKPSQFTHQGAPWMRDWYQPLRNVPWPLNAESLDEALANVADGHEHAEAGRRALRGAVQQGVGTRQQMADDMQALAEWSQRVERPVIINEFGVFTRFAPHDSRVRWIDELTDLMAEHGFGWSHWDYQGSLGFAEGEPGERTFQQDVVEAMME